MSASRAARLAEVIRSETSAIIQQTLRDPRLGFVSITDVVVSRDLRHAKIFISVLGDKEAKRRSLAGLDRARGHIRSLLGQRLKVRFTPQILFRLDESIERGVRLAALMREVRQGDASGSPSGHRPDA